MPLKIDEIFPEDLPSSLNDYFEVFGRLRERSLNFINSDRIEFDDPSFLLYIFKGEYVILNANTTNIKFVGSDFAVNSSIIIIREPFSDTVAFAHIGHEYDVESCISDIAIKLITQAQRLNVIMMEPMLEVSFFGGFTCKESFYPNQKMEKFKTSLENLGASSSNDKTFSLPSEIDYLENEDDNDEKNQNAPESIDLGIVNESERLVLNILNSLNQSKLIYDLIILCSGIINTDALEITSNITDMYLFNKNLKATKPDHDNTTHNIKHSTARRSSVFATLFHNIAKPRKSEMFSQNNEMSEIAIPEFENKFESTNRRQRSSSVFESLTGFLGRGIRSLGGRRFKSTNHSDRFYHGPKISAVAFEVATRSPFPVSKFFVVQLTDELATLFSPSETEDSKGKRLSFLFPLSTSIQTRKKSSLADLFQISRTGRKSSPRLQTTSQPADQTYVSSFTPQISRKSSAAIDTSFAYAETLDRIYQDNMSELAPNWVSRFATSCIPMIVSEQLALNLPLTPDTIKNESNNFESYDSSSNYINSINNNITANLFNLPMQCVYDNTLMPSLTNLINNPRRYTLPALASLTDENLTTMIEKRSRDSLCLKIPFGIIKQTLLLIYQRNHEIRKNNRRKISMSLQKLGEADAVPDSAEEDEIDKLKTAVNTEIELKSALTTVYRFLGSSKIFPIPSQNLTHALALVETYLYPESIVDNENSFMNRYSQTLLPSSKSMTSFRGGVSPLVTDDAAFQPLLVSEVTATDEHQIYACALEYIARAWDGQMLLALACCIKQALVYVKYELGAALHTITTSVGRIQSLDESTQKNATTATLDNSNKEHPGEDDETQQYMIVKYELNSLGRWQMVVENNVTYQGTTI